MEWMDCSLAGKKMQFLHAKERNEAEFRGANAFPVCQALFRSFKRWQKISYLMEARLFYRRGPSPRTWNDGKSQHERKRKEVLPITQLSPRKVVRVRFPFLFWFFFPCRVSAHYPNLPIYPPISPRALWLRRSLAQCGRRNPDKAINAGFWGPNCASLLGVKCSCHRDLPPSVKMRENIRG